MKDFLMKKLLKSQLGNVSDEQINQVMTTIEKNPELFQRIALEVKGEVAKGRDQMEAMMGVMKKYEEELKKLNQ